VSAVLQFGDQEGVRGVFVALLELLKQKVGGQLHNPCSNRMVAATAQCKHAGVIAHSQ
jgi:hypothetical protein